MSTATFKVKIGEVEKELSFRNPTQAELLAMDMEYRKIYSLCLREGVISEAEARKLAEKRGVWSDDDDKEITRLSLEIGLLEQIVEEANAGTSKLNREEVMAKVNTLTELRNKLMSKIGLKVEIIAQSAEGLANQQRMHKFTALCCVEAGSGKRLFESETDYALFAVNQRDILSEIYKQAYFTEYGDPSRMSENWAEVKYLKKVFADKAVDKTIEKEREEKAEVAGSPANTESEPKP